MLFDATRTINTEPLSAQVRSDMRSALVENYLHLRILFQFFMFLFGISFLLSFVAEKVEEWAGWIVGIVVIADIILVWILERNRQDNIRKMDDQKLQFEYNKLVLRQFSHMVTNMFIIKIIICCIAYLMIQARIGKNIMTLLYK